MDLPSHNEQDYHVDPIDTDPGSRVERESWQQVGTAVLLCALPRTGSRRGSGSAPMPPRPRYDRLSTEMASGLEAAGREVRFVPDRESPLEAAIMARNPGAKDNIGSA